MKGALKRSLAVIALAALSACCLLTACDKTEIADNTEHFDKITKTLKLSKSYEGKKLMSDDGIGAATLIGDTTDGDTTNFRLVVGGSTVTVRYQGVDTPESTADVERWGRAASMFTNERLHAATEIVIESASGGIPEKDSVGQRSLCYVWYKTEQDKFKCLNLELVENGYSRNKEDATSAYYKYFEKAENFARKVQLRMFSELKDPLFDIDPVETSLKDILANPNNYEAYMKVKLDAYVADDIRSDAGAATFVLVQYDAAEKKTYSLNLYAGHSSAADKLSVGDLYHIVGNLQKHNDSWQISGITVNNRQKDDPGTSWLKQAGYYLIFDSTNPLFTGDKTANCFSDLTVTSVSLDGTTLTFTGSAEKIKPEKALDDSPAVFTFTTTVPAGYAGEIAVGTKLSVSAGYQTEAGSGQVEIPAYTNITIK